MYGHRFLGASKAVVERSRNAQLSFLAASLAYYMLVSLFPLGLLAFVVASTVGGEAFADAVIGTVSAFLSPSGTALLDEALRAGAGRGGATVVGIALLLWSGLRLFRGLDVAFTLAYGRNDPGSLASQLLDATAALLGIAVAVVALAVVNGALAAAGRELTDLAGTAVLVVSLFVAFYPFYYLFPDVEMAYRDAVPGAIFAALGWTVLGATFTFYAANAGAFALYGAVGAILLLVTWFYVAGIVLLVGAVINAVLGTAPTGETAHPRTVFTEAQGGDRQGQKGAARNVTTMSDERATPDADADPVDRRAGDATANDAEVERLRCEQDPTFGGSSPEPAPERLETLAERVAETDATLGIANDGDADRVTVVTPDRAALDPNLFFAATYDALLAGEVLADPETYYRSGDVVRTVSTSSIVDRVAESHGQAVHETPVGFKWVAQAMADHDTLMGGEESGGFGLTAHLRNKDGVLVALVAAAIAAEESYDERVAALLDEHGEIHQSRISVDCPAERKDPVLSELEDALPGSMAGASVDRVSTVDGFKVFLDDGSWVLVRPSGTEPKLRVYAEAGSEERVEELLSAGGDLVEPLV